MDQLTKLLTETKIPVGKTAKAVFDWLNLHAAAFFNTVSSLLDGLIGAILKLLEFPHPLIFTALAELSTRQIAESVQATGMPENAEAGKKGGRIARRARRELEQKTGKSVVTGENFLPPSKEAKRLTGEVSE